MGRHDPSPASTAHPDPGLIVPQSAPGIELRPLGSAAGPAAVSLPGGRHFEVSGETARVLRLVDGRRSLGEIAGLLSTEAGVRLEPARLAEMMAESLVPTGLVRLDDGAPWPAPTARPRPRYDRLVLLSAARTRWMAAAFVPLFSLPGGLLMLGVALLVHAWFWSLRVPVLLGGRFLLDPEWIPALLLALASFLFHELGHAAALLARGESPGAIGVAYRGPWFAFYADVSRAWMLPRGGRLLVDAGGVLVQFLLAGLLMAVHGATDSSLAARTALLLDFAVLVNLAPLPRFDGSWLLADLHGLRDPQAMSAEAREAGDPAPRPLPAGLRWTLKVTLLLHAALLLALCGWIALRAAAEWRGGS